MSMPMISTLFLNWLSTCVFWLYSARTHKNREHKFCGSTMFFGTALHGLLRMESTSSVAARFLDGMRPLAREVLGGLRGSGSSHEPLFV